VALPEGTADTETFLETESKMPPRGLGVANG